MNPDGQMAQRSTPQCDAAEGHRRPRVVGSYSNRAARYPGAQPTLAQVTLVHANEFLVTSQRGQLEVLIGNEVHNVPEATSYRVVISFGLR